MAYLDLEKSLLDNRYVVGRRLRHGSHAELFLAEDHIGRRPVVIKALNTELKGTLDRETEGRLIVYFEMEGALLERLRHAHIIPLLGHGTASDLQGKRFHYLILEYMAGGDLMQLCRSRPLSLGEATEYCRQLCQGLTYAHDRSVIHRDIKPQNVLLTEDLQSVKIADFGIARMLRGEEDDEVTRGIGTESYAPPECFGDRELELTPAADIYGLAKTYYVALTGEAPRQFSQLPITALPERLGAGSCGSELLRVLERATRDDPRERYESIREFWRDVATVTRVLRELDLADDEETIVAPRSNRVKFSGSPISDSTSGAIRLEVALNVPEIEITSSTALGVFPRAAAPVSETASYPSIPAEKRELVGWSARLTRRLFTLGLCAAFWGGAWGTWRVARRLKERVGTVNTRNLNLRAGPGESYPSVAVIPYGSRVQRLGGDPTDGWVEVEVIHWNGPRSESARGWVRERFVDWSEARR